ncbi:Arabinan endo-1 5-alpha-L-arabinosidase [uncultured Paludibacter sp.]|uniref:Arabinan endo-1 5-alpha-L-arabinosidase n=1 Tax=uncultured Paludibacter sp. TaxID=497635 RepID=A0A653ABB4_9BACT|nr:Arabinan endo-1 5-alpha-L-arabinosidase [uncultured Paludibacter sp.]
MKTITAFLISILLFTGETPKNDISISKRLPSAAETLYQNPLFTPDLADPSFIKASDGWFYAYGTENVWEPGKHRITPIIKSKDMIHWEYVADAFQTKPVWHSRGGIWAPQIVFNSTDGTYYLYYSFSAWGDSNPGIGVAASKKPEGPFVDLGKILDNQSSGVTNSIDQFFIETGKGRNKKKYLIWGSFAGIYGVEMADMKTAKMETKFKIAGNGFEGSYIYEHNGYYYYFGSNGNCCDGAQSQYRLSVARSKSIKGPFLTKEGVNIIDNSIEGTPFLHGDKNTGWIGPGHNAEIIVDDRGRYFILYHAIQYSNPLLPNGATRRPLMMDEIIWIDGWPTIEGSVPSFELKSAPYFKKK